MSFANSGYTDIEEYRAYVRKYLRGYRTRPDVKASMKRYRQSENGKAAHIKGQNIYYKKNPDKIYAHGVVQRAIKKGLMTRKPCVICGEKITHAHHEDYSKPYDVIWLCQFHHIEEHQKARAR